MGEIVRDEDDDERPPFLASWQTGPAGPRDERKSSMNTIFDGVRKGDVALAAVVTGLGAALMIENMMAGPDSGTRVDSHSWLMLPLFLLAMVSVLWWRRALPRHSERHPVISASTAAEQVGSPRPQPCRSGPPR